MFYERTGEYLIRTVPTQTKATRLAAKNFGRASSTAKLLRQFLAPLIPDRRDKQMQNRLTVAMRGFLASAETQAVIDSRNNPLAGFGFDAGSAISWCLLFPFTISNQEGGKVNMNIPAINPLEAINASEGTTKAELSLMAAAFHPDGYPGVSGGPEIRVIPYTGEQQMPAPIELECSAVSGSIMVVALSVTYFSGSKKIAQPGFTPVEIVAAWRNEN